MSFYRSVLCLSAMLFVLVLVGNLCGQHLINHYTADDGLQANSVTNLLVDEMGFLWVATSSGVSRFNGLSFKDFPYPILPETGTRDIVASYLTTDLNSNLLGFGLSGTYKFDKLRQEFVHSTYPLVTRIHYLYNIYNHQNRLFFLNEQKEITPFDVEGGQPLELPDISHLISHFETIWFATMDQIGYLDADLNPVHFLDTTELFKDARSVFLYPGSSEEYFWILAGFQNEMHDLYKVNIRARSLELVVKGFPMISKVEEDRFGKTWLLAIHNGLYYIETGETEPRLFEPIGRMPLSTMIQSNDILWVGGNGSGLYKVDLRPRRFGLIPVGSTIGSAKVGVLTKNIQIDEESIWILRYDEPGAILRLDKNLKDGEEHRISNGSESSPPVDFERLSDGRFVIGYLLNPPAFYDPHNRKLESDPAFKTHLYTFSGSGILGVHDSTLFYTNYREVNRLNLNNPGSSPPPIKLPFAETHPITNWQHDGYFDVLRNRFWFPSMNYLNWLDLQTDSIHVLQIPEAGGNLIKHIHPAENGLWLAMQNGLLYLNPDTGKKRFFDERDGMPNSFVYGILEDDSGNLWISTNKGLSRATVNFANELPELTFKNFTLKDGIQSNEFNSYAFFKEQNGTMWFGGIGGINYFHPDSIKDEIETPQVVLTDFRLFNRSATLDTTIVYKRKIVLNYAQNDVSFDFIGLMSRRSEDITYRVKLVGQDAQWMELGKEHTVRYTNLRPGNYTLMIEAANYDGIWGAPKTLPVSVSGPFWFSTWFYVLSLLVLGGGMFGISRFIAQRKYVAKLAELERQNMINKERERIARDLHDEIGANLTHISILSEVENLNSRTSDVARKSVQSLSEIVWSLNPKNDLLENTVSYIQEYTEQFFQHTNIRVLFEIEDQFPEYRLTSDIRHHLLMAIKEVLNNCIKYSEADTVWLSITHKNFCLQISIRDNGIGFDAKMIKSAGNGLHHIKTRLAPFGGQAVVESAPSAGCEVTIALPTEH